MKSQNPILKFVRYGHIDKPKAICPLNFSKVGVIICALRVCVNVYCD